MADPGTLRVGVDVGGTFTDLACVRDGRVVTAKVPSTPSDQAAGVMRALEASALDAESIAVLAHGTTVATNALLERSGERTALITTEGFRDVIEIARQNRPSLYDLTLDRPPPLVPRDLRFTVSERMGPSGVVAPLDESTVVEAIDRLRGSGAGSVAICLLFSFLHPAHEQRVAELIRAALPDVHVSVSCEVLPEFREYERTSTVAADAYLGPKLSAYLESLARKCSNAGIHEPLVMQSSGGVVDIGGAARRAAACVLSGPAGGVVGAARCARASGIHDALSFDMGGTSTDVAPIVSGEIRTTTEAVIAGVPIRFPMVDVHTVSAGGGSIAWVDEGDALRVGPRSAGADPGPICYSRGGDEPTVTDANLVLGYLGDGSKLGGEISLDLDPARTALDRLGATVGLDAVAAAEGVVRVANSEMARALRKISVERGLDPRPFALVSFGGAGPMHACALADELGMATVLVPAASGVLSALGLALSDLRWDCVKAFPAPVAAGGGEDAARLFVGMEDEAAAALGAPDIARQADLRYRGQSFEITVVAGDPGELVARFHRAHEDRYGYRMENEEIEIVALRVVATVATVEAELREVREVAGVSETDARTRPARFEGDWVETAVIAREGMSSGDFLEGPAIVELAEATCVVPPRWGGEIDTVGTLVLSRS